MNSNLNNKIKYIDSSKEEINSKNSYEKDEDDINDEEEDDNIQDYNSINNKDYKAFIDNDLSPKQKLKSSNQIKDKTYYQFINAILHDDKKQAEKILNSCQSYIMVNHQSLEGITPIQYATLYSSISCFKYLLSLKAYTDLKVEGLHLIHISLARAIFKKEQEKCFKMFYYIYEKLPEQKNYIDRLGRTYLHIIFEYDFWYALEKININLEDLFQEDNNGEYVINYVYIYNSCQCFWKVAKDPEFLAEIYREIRKRYENNKSAKYLLKEKFLDNLFIHQCFYAIATLVINCNLFIDELMEDLINLKNYYSQLEQRNNYYIEQNGIIQMKENINYTITIVERLKNKDNFQGQFKFPKKFREYTAIVFNTDCIQHIKLPDEPLKHLMSRIQIFENSDRLAHLIDRENGIMLNDQVFHFKEVNLGKEEKDNGQLKYSGYENILFYESNRKSCLNDILKCHDFRYIKKLKELCSIKNNNSNNYNKRKEYSPQKEKGIKNNLNNNIDYSNPLYKNILNNSISINYKKLDTDTYINEYSYENIYYTTGCVFDAIDLVMNGSVKNAFVLIRPPGHHAGYSGQVENNELTSSGFCIVNNVSIGAAYTKNKYSNEIKKIAIFDFDVHHGNGTEEIIQMLNGKDFYKSFNYDKICSFSTNYTQQINWHSFDDAKNILFISTHIYDENNPNSFYPYSGGIENNTSKESNIYPGGIYNIPLEPKKNLSYEYKNILRTKIIPRLYKFQPDIIFLSSGFDGHENETINQNNMFLNEFDYAFLTQQIQFVANKFCKGRLISVLEGGYNINTGIISSFSQSVFTHARSLNSSINMMQCFDVKLSGLKRKYEMDDDIEIYNRLNKIKSKFKKNVNNNNEEDSNPNEVY